MACYFILTTLSTVGYGDITPRINYEYLFTLVILLCGVALFSYIMQSFIVIIESYNQKMGNYDYNDELKIWMINQRKYIYPKHIPIELINDIYKE